MVSMIKKNLCRAALFALVFGLALSLSYADPEDAAFRYNGTMLMELGGSEYSAGSLGTLSLNYAGDVLDSESHINNKTIYDYVKGEFEKVADGERDNARFEINSESAPAVKLSWSQDEISPYDEDGINSQEDLRSFLKAANEEFKKSFDIGEIFSAVYRDCPYEQYWTSRSSGSGSYSIQTSQNSGKYTAYIENFYLYSDVDSEFRADAYTNENLAVDSAKTAAASAVIKENAAAIVSEFSELGDYEKLKAYKDRLCELIVYDENAADYGSAVVGIAPWQIKNVFDGDADTNVVCEGYAKAFQYLCELSEFEKDIKCYSVSGVLTANSNSGAHMWNIVSIEGENYLVDVTNCDGYEGIDSLSNMLFLKAPDEGYDNKESGYLFSIPKTPFVKDGKNYFYNPMSFGYYDISSAYGDEILSLSNKSYSEAEAPEAGTKYFDAAASSMKISSDGRSVEVRLSAASGDGGETIFCAVYDESGKLLGIKEAAVKRSAPRAYVFEFELAGADHYHAFMTSEGEVACEAL